MIPLQLSWRPLPVRRAEYLDESSQASCVWSAARTDNRERPIAFGTGITPSCALSGLFGPHVGCSYIVGLHARATDATDYRTRGSPSFSASTSWRRAFTATHGASGIRMLMGCSDSSTLRSGWGCLDVQSLSFPCSTSLLRSGWQIPWL